jgi:hypothetical protein
MIMSVIPFTYTTWPTQDLINIIISGKTTQSTDQIPAELIKAEGGTIHSVIHRLINSLEQGRIACAVEEVYHCICL